MDAVAVCQAMTGEQDIASNGNKADMTSHIGDYFGRVDLDIGLDATRDSRVDPFYSKENISHLEMLKRLDDKGLLKFTVHKMVQE